MENTVNDTLDHEPRPKSPNSMTCFIELWLYCGVDCGVDCGVYRGPAPVCPPQRGELPLSLPRCFTLAGAARGEHHSGGFVRPENRRRQRQADAPEAPREEEDAPGGQRARLREARLRTRLVREAPALEGAPPPASPRPQGHQLRLGGGGGRELRGHRRHRPHLRAYVQHLQHENTFIIVIEHKSSNKNIPG
eukprot:1187097-Prorocentrum_minimum.AAC.1